MDGALARIPADALQGTGLLRRRGMKRPKPKRRKSQSPPRQAMRRGVLHHMAFRVTDVERSTRFYVPVLTFMGYECAGKSDRYQDWKLMVEGAPHEIQLCQRLAGNWGASLMSAARWASMIILRGRRCRRKRWIYSIRRFWFRSPPPVIAPFLIRPCSAPNTHRFIMRCFLRAGRFEV